MTKQARPGTSLFAQNSPHGRVTLSMVRAGETLSKISIAGKKVTGVVYQLLAAAQYTHRLANLPLIPEESLPNPPLDLVPNKVGLAGSNKPGHARIMFQFGDVALGITLPTETMEEIGRGMIAENASGSQH